VTGNQNSYSLTPTKCLQSTWGAKASSQATKIYYL